MKAHTIDVLISWRWGLFALAVVLAAIALPYSRSMEFDRSVENMFATDDPLLVSYRKLKRTFGGNEIVMVVYEEPELFGESGAGLARLAEISGRCESVPGVAAVLSLERIVGEQILAAENALARKVRQLFENYTHSADLRTVAVVCMLEPSGQMVVSREATIAGLREVAESLPKPLGDGVLAGEPVMVVEGFRYLEEDGRRLGWWSTLLLAVTIVLCFRSLRWVLVPVAVVQWSLILTRATLSATGLRLSMVSSMLTAIVTVVGVATVVHIIVRYRDARAAGLFPQPALLRAGTLVAAPVFWACTTDAIGFLSLTISRVGPVQDFGIMMAIGSLLVLPAAAFLTAVPVLWRNRGEPFLSPERDRRLSVWLDRSLAHVMRRPKSMLTFLVIVTALAVVGVIRLEIETDFTKNFRAGSPVVVAYTTVEGQLGGAGVLDILLPAPANLDWDYLQRVAALEEELRERFLVAHASQAGLTKVLSLADAVIQTSPLDLATAPALVRGGLVRAALATIRGQIPAFADALYGKDPQNAEQHYFRIMLRAPEQQSSFEKLRLIQGVQAVSRAHFPPRDDEPPAEVTGFFVLLAHLVDSILRDQWLAFSLAMIGIGAMMTLAFRSPKLALIALIPNALPIIWVLGGMGWLGGRVNMGVAMIAAVSLGLSVDSSIHYVTFFGRARRQGQTTTAAIFEVQRTVGRAVVFSTLALIVGFTVLCMSDFVPTIYFGFLVGLSMLGGLLGNLFLLPLLLATFTTAKGESENPVIK